MLKIARRALTRWLTMASELARYRLSVRIVDKNTQRADKSKALVLWAWTLELIDRMSPNCADRFIQAGLKKSVSILSGNQTIGRSRVHFRLPGRQIFIMAKQGRTPPSWRLLEEFHD